RDLNAGTMIFVEGREAEPLNGRWRFTEDQYDRGLRGRWHQPPVLHSSEHRRPYDYEPDGGDEMPVPSCWNVCRPEYFYYEGSAWYARHFSYRARAAGERVFLRIGAAAYDAKVFLNARFLGHHTGASTPFFVELTDHLQDDNLLQICVNNARTTDRVPMRNTDWFNYGGLYREVELFRLPAAFIQELQVHLAPNDAYDKIAVRVRVSDDTAAGSVHLRIPKLGVDAALPLKNGIADATITASPDLWSPESPALYDLTAQFRDDCVIDRVGFRRIQVRGTEILLNGQPIFLRGISVHEDDEQLGKTTSEADIRRRYAHAKELGCNFLRLAHYPHHELAAKIADEVGLLLWEEIPVYWSIAFNNPATYQDAENQLLELIQRDFNRASVIIWAVGNETPDTDARLQFMGDLAR
ncbi:MAG: glycoside hydrolase family 2, partial [Chloroflexi bacterium]|nr:glycoside hydrolase family 2 [Chloroflexota bacterium]